MTHLVLPAFGQAIEIRDGQRRIPDFPIVPFIEGDGIGVDVTPAMKQVVNAAVSKAYQDKRRIAWLEIYAGEKAARLYGNNDYLPRETLAAIQQYRVAIKGPLSTPVGGGIRSLNVALRQKLDLFVCQRPVRYFPGTPAPVRHPEYVDMVIFRENAEDIYAGVEFQAQSASAKQLMQFLLDEMHVSQIRFPTTSGIGVKVVSQEGSYRLIREAIRYAIANKRASVTLVHKGNIMKFTEGAFCEWGYQLAREEFAAKPLDGGPWHVIEADGHRVVVKDCIADAFLQQILLRPKEYDVIATMNLNGDYISDALAAQVGGIGIAPGANLSDDYALFEATHGTAPGHAGKDIVNPSSLILSAEMMLRHLGWQEAADYVILGLKKAIVNHQVTYDLARLLDDVQPIKCSAFAACISDYIVQS